MERPRLPDRTPSAAEELLTRYLQGLDNAGDPDRLYPSGQTQFHTGRVPNGPSGGRNQRLVLMGDRRFVISA